MLTTLLLLQAAAQAQSAPDIQLDVSASIRRVRIEQQGEASLELSASPDGGTDLRVEAPEGRRTYRNVNLRVQAEARIADPLNPGVQLRTEASADGDQNREEPETRQPE